VLAIIGMLAVRLILLWACITQHLGSVLKHLKRKNLKFFKWKFHFDPVINVRDLVTDYTTRDIGFAAASAMCQVATTCNIHETCSF
jgi:hypothetical protein